MGKYYSEEKLKQNINDINFIISKSGYGRYVEELENRIDKAIEYIEKNQNTELIEDCYYKFKDIIEFDDILYILKGVNNE